MIKKVLFLFVFGISTHLCFSGEGDSFDYKNSLKEANNLESIKETIKQNETSLFIKNIQILKNSDDPKKQEIGEWLEGRRNQRLMIPEDNHYIRSILESDIEEDEKFRLLEVFMKSQHHNFLKSIIGGGVLSIIFYYLKR